MEKEEFERKWKELNIDFDEHALIYLRGSGYIRATKYKWLDDEFIKFFYDDPWEYIEVGGFEVEEIEGLMKEKD